MTSDFRPEVEIQLFRACAMHPAIIIRTVRSFRSLVVSLVHSRLDYGNFLLVGLPAYQQRHLASVLTAAARLVYRLRRNDHITDALATLHWLRLPERVDFKVADMAYRVLHHGLAPPYLSQLTRVADLPGRRRLRSSSSQSLLVPSFVGLPLGGGRFL